MGELEWLEGYEGQSLGELLDMAATHRKDAIVLAIEQALLAKQDRVGLEALSSLERYVIAVESMEREVNNGGYLQFFENTPEHASTIVEALQTIECKNAAGITLDAIRALGIRDGDSTDRVLELAEDCDDECRIALSACDDRYIDEVEDLATALFAAIQAQRQEIVF